MVSGPFTITLTATKTGPATYDFAVAGITAAQAVLDFGDGSAPLTLFPAAGAASTDHTYTAAGHHDYTATVTQTVTPWSSTLQELSTDFATLQALADAVPTLNDICRTADTATAAVSVDVGALTIYATVLSDLGPPPPVQVEAWIAAPAGVTGWTVTRLDPVFGQTVVAAGGATSGAESFLDYDAPLGVTVSYRLQVTTAVGTSSADSNTVVISGLAGCWLSDPVSSSAMQLQLQAWDERTRAARRSVLAVISRPDPVVLLDYPLMPSGEWTIHTRTDAETEQLLSILTTSGVVLLRTQPATSIKTVYAAVGDITETRMTNNALDQRRLVTVAVQEVTAMPATASLVDANLAGLATLGETLLELSEVRPTLLQLSQIRVSA